MKIFIDTSSLIKLYHTETGTEELDNLFQDFSIEEIFLSDLTKIEFDSAIWKKVRTKELKKDEALDLIKLFRNDFDKFSFINIDDDLIAQAKKLIEKYGINGLRTLDSIQLSSIISIKSEISIVASADILLKEFIILEGIKTF